MNDIDIKKKKYMKQKKKNEYRFHNIRKKLRISRTSSPKRESGMAGYPIVYHEATRPQRRSERENLLANGSAESSDELRMK